MQSGMLSLVTLCGALLLGVVGASRVPVLLWGKEPALEESVAVSARPLQHYSVDEWVQLARKQTKAHDLTVVFVEETLSPEDLSAKDAEGRTAFEGLRARARGGHLVHLPSVLSAVSTLKDVADPDQVNRVKLTDEGLSADVHSAQGKFLFIELDDAEEGEDRLRMLARHDAFVNQMFDKLLDKHPSVLAVYTARYPSWEIPSERSRRDTGRHLMQQPPENIEGFYRSNKTYQYSPAMSYTKDTNTIWFSFTGEPTESGDSDSLEVKWTTNDTVIKDVTFKLSNSRGYWSLDNVTYNTDVSTEMKDIYAPSGFSYSCRHLQVTFDDKSSLLMKPFQLEAFFSTQPDGKFDSSYDCVGTMSTPIWSGLFIVFLLILIIAGGLSLMMEIRTMDRFDDPKGKTITINASE